MGRRHTSVVEREFVALIVLEAPNVLARPEVCHRDQGGALDRLQTVRSDGAKGPLIAPAYGNQAFASRGGALYDLRTAYLQNATLTNAVRMTHSDHVQDQKRIIRQKGCALSQATPHAPYRPEAAA